MLVVASAGLAISGRCIKTAAARSKRWSAVRSAWRVNKGEVLDGAAQSSGQGAAISDAAMRGLPSGVCPSTKAWPGLQQQWPCSTQQAIVQTSSDELPASAIGA